jgi:hypothetical protein
MNAALPTVPLAGEIEVTLGNGFPFPLPFGGGGVLVPPPPQLASITPASATKIAHPIFRCITLRW